MDQYLSILKEHWGYDDFRGIQRQIIESIGAGRDTLGLMPTGGGKSITFQVPALAMEGTCIVISPLIALMKDQVENLRDKHIRAAALHSELSRSQIIDTLENAVFGAVKILYVSPERLQSDLFLEKLSHIQVSFICVDEAHCISQWGHDFRPSYLKIALIRKLLPQAPVLALTASATPEVVKDIEKQLTFRAHNVIRMSFARPNLAYIVRRTHDKLSRLIDILNAVEGSTIVYVSSRRHTQMLATRLQEKNMSAVAFHAGLDKATKNERQKQWKTGETRVMVATNAFGMGIDKADVRLVVHFDCPESIEAYFQEAGRAGRDGQRAWAVMLFNAHDGRRLRTHLAREYPELSYVRDVYDHLGYFFQVADGYGFRCTFALPIERFCKAYDYQPEQMKASLRILARAGYIDFHEEEDAAARLKFILDRDQLYLLKSGNMDEERLITILLRNYSGLFNEYRYIDELYMAQLTGLTPTEVYEMLVSLRQRSIVDYIPQKADPRVTFLQSRMPSERLVFPPESYAMLKAAATKRTEAILEYVVSTQYCRSRQLLSYFGEISFHDCNHCDSCRGQDMEIAAMAHD